MTNSDTKEFIIDEWPGAGVWPLLRQKAPLCFYFIPERI
jgi:hypothetical protein